MDDGDNSDNNDDCQQSFAQLAWANVPYCNHGPGQSVESTGATFMQTSNPAPRIRTTELGAYVGQTVQLQGWLHNMRRLGGVNFIILRDGWGAAQAVTENEADLAPLRNEELAAETVLAIEGVVIAEPQAPGGYELHQPRLAVITPVREIPPVGISKREVNAGLPTLLDHAVVANRHPARRAVFRLAAGVMAAFRDALQGRSFTEIQTPKIVASATESGAT